MRIISSHFLSFGSRLHLRGASDFSSAQQWMTVLPGVLTLSQVKVCELTRNKHKAVLYANPLGKACYELNQERVKACLDDLDRFRLLEPGLVYASEVRPTAAADARPLNAKEWRIFQAEIGCQPLHLTCLACGLEVDRLQKEGAKEKAKATQLLAIDIVKLLMEYGAQLDLVDVGPMENTALHLAARCGAVAGPIDSQRLEELAVSLKERFNTLTDRLARFEAGDLVSAQEEIASERELRGWWQQRSSDLSTQAAGHWVTGCWGGMGGEPQGSSDASGEPT
eukprot:Skav229743  [mRNA]  locus=scaffold1287:355217:362945:+ [translate_table: standard]